ncbi:MAG TPA: hypothetical protein VLG37_00680 [Candidatus Saccharimonadales bacterium]|nr:hypothetical protein [Candidatus Saccharimonadales bacterium]
MFHALATFILAYVLCRWLSFELKQKPDFRRYGAWLGGAVLLPVLASFVSLAFGGKVGNFILHSVGGGVASTFLFFYLLKTFGFRLVWRLEFVFLFAFVSTLGVLNELAEYAYELLHLGILSFDPHDTWRDLLANAVGAVVAWLVIRTFYRLRWKPLIR